MSYTEGAHNSPADPKDRLVRIGSKYQASAPTVADGDNAYLLLDSAGRLLISGAAAHDAAAAGNPLRVAGVYRTAIPAVAAGDIVDLLLDAATPAESNSLWKGSSSLPSWNMTRGRSTAKQAYFP